MRFVCWKSESESKTVIGKNNLDRQTGIELLKVIAIFLIVLSHVVQALGSSSEVVGDQSYLVEYYRASTGWRNLFLVLLRYCGVVGNLIFFVCSAWFLAESCRCNLRKWFSMLTEVWLISVLILLAVRYLGREPVGVGMVLKCLAPTIFANNWYLTCYLMFYPLHPYLNSIMDSMDQRTLLRWCIALLAIYFGLEFLRDQLLLGSHPMITWVTIYALVFYLKKYLPRTMGNCRLNVYLFLIALVLHLGSVLFLNAFFGGAMTDNDIQLLHFSKNANPFLLVMVISLFNLTRSLKLHSGIINEVSGLSMLIYILHDNILLRTYYRPRLLLFLYRKYGYAHLIRMVFLVSAGIFLLSAICAWLYRITLQTLVRRCSDKVLAFVCRLLKRPEEWLIKQK